MRKRVLKAVLATVVLAACLLCTLTSVSALDDKYTFEEIGMSLKIPKGYTVITKDSDRFDEAFTTLGLDYDETVTAFSAAHIYLQAVDPENTFRITVAVTSDENSANINNYSDITPQQREEILNNFLSDSMCTSAIEVKHGGNIFFDLTLLSKAGDDTTYINQCNTVINGENINLTLEKSKESILPDEAKALSNVANSLSFDKIIRLNEGPSFEWWRILLWVLVLAVISFVISFIYRQYNISKKKKLEERRRRRATRLVEQMQNEDDASKEQENPVSFEEVLGYEDEKDYQTRADTDLESFDISVKEKDPMSGMSFFEDSGDSIDDGTDYFDTYFKQPTATRTPVERAANTVGAYIKIAFHHLGYFFQNIFRAIAKIFKGGKTKN